MIDPRGPRVGAAATSLVLATVLITGSGWLLAAQAAVFTLGAVLGPSASPYGVLYARLIRPRLSAPAHLEDAGPPRFAQAVGLAFAGAGLIGFLAGWAVVAYLAVAAALAAAFLNAVFGFCLGCEVYLLYRRIVTTRTAIPTEVIS